VRDAGRKVARCVLGAVAVTVALAAWSPISAWASTAAVQNSDGAWRLLVDASSAQEANVIAITRDPGSGDYVIEDQAGTVPAPPQEDSQCRTTDATHVTCTSAQVQTVNVTLGDGDDRFAIADEAYPTVPAPRTELPLSVDGDGGEDTIVGGGGPDDIRGSDDDDHLYGGGGDDKMSGDPGTDMVDGGEGADTVTGDLGNDTLFGGPGDDEVQGDEGNDTLDGGAGNDEVRGNSGTDTILGGEGDDRLDFPPSSGRDPTDGSDTLRGGPGNDVLNAGPAGERQDADDMGGGDGVDRADFHLRSGPLTIRLDGAANDGEADEHDNVRTDVEEVIGGSNDDVLAGAAAPNMLDGRGGDDTIEGGGGDDTLIGGVNDPGSDNLTGDAGNDTTSGGPGDDELDGGDGNDTEYGGGGTDTVEGEDGDDSLAGGAGGDSVNGGEGNDVLNGGEVGLVGGDAGDDLNGGPGADTLYGGRGNDKIDGGLGADYISGGSEKDTVSYEDRTSRVFVTLDGQANDGERGEMDNVLPDVETIVGGRQGDDLFGDSDNNTVNGGEGEDLIVGASGPDRLLGGDAPDVVQARDGVADEVTCGDGRDLVIADAQDKTIDCETKDLPGARRLIVGRYALLRPQGEFLLRLPEGHRFFPLAGNLKIPIGSTIDPQGSVVRLGTATNSAGARQFASVSAGRFTVRQRSGRRPVTELQLAGRLPRCARSSTRHAGLNAEARSSPRRLLVDVRKRKRKGRDTFTVRGKHSIAGAPGTAWLTEDRCDGTLTTVISGTVHVREFRRGKTVTVRPGKPYLATPS
jgi:Ca2+-binding RTX toxin-like protein